MTHGERTEANLQDPISAGAPGIAPAGEVMTVAVESKQTSLSSPRDEWDGPRKGTGLALSGGGFRASLFGLGSLCRLNDLGMLRGIRRITGVSGGALTAGVLAAHWKELIFDGNGRATNFESVVAARVRAFCSKTVDRKAILFGLLPFVSAAGIARRIFEKHLIKTKDGRIATLADLPKEGEGPDFVFIATCLQTGSSFRFNREGLYDWKLGNIPKLDITLGTALAASAAFPPFLSPLLLGTDPAQWIHKPEIERLVEADLVRAKLRLGDGGIYDNMGTEPLWKSMACVLISDAGAPFDFVTRPRKNWISQLGRVRNILIQQTRALRKRTLMADLKAKRYSGAYWGISTKIGNYELAEPMCVDTEESGRLESIGTRLKAFNPQLQEKLINWGYALADAAIRRHVDTTVAHGSWPYTKNKL
jgi:NTE family protein